MVDTTEEAGQFHYPVYGTCTFGDYLLYSVLSAKQMSRKLRSYLSTRNHLFRLKRLLTTLEKPPLRRMQQNKLPSFVTNSRRRRNRTTYVNFFCVFAVQQTLFFINKKCNVYWVVFCVLHIYHLYIHCTVYAVFLANIHRSSRLTNLFIYPQARITTKCTRQFLQAIRSYSGPCIPTINARQSQGLWIMGDLYLPRPKFQAWN